MTIHIFTLHLELGCLQIGVRLFINWMKIVLQHKATRFYLAKDDKWTANIVDARDFGTSLKALDFARRADLRQIHIVLKFPDPKYDIILPAVGGQQSQQGSRL